MMVDEDATIYIYTPSTSTILYMILLGCSLVDAHYSCLLDQAQPSYTYMCMFLIITIIIYIHKRILYSICSCLREPAKLAAREHHATLCQRFVTHTPTPTHPYLSLAISIRYIWKEMRGNGAANCAGLVCMLTR